jgi:transcriptional regulator with XRE-family HTH domain
MITAGSRHPSHSAPPSPETLAYYARTVRLARKRKGWTQQQLAAAAGLSCTAISHVEQGRYFLRLDHSARLARVLEVPLAQLVPAAPSSPEARLFVLLLQRPAAMTHYLIKMLENATPVQGCPLHHLATE